MRSTFGGFEIAKSGLFAAQQNLNITGHNVANAHTPGYTRQRLNVEAIPAPGYSGLIAYSDKSVSGQGVNMLYVDQIRNPFLDRQFREEYTSTNHWATKDYEFSMVEALFNNEIIEDASGVSAVFKDFYAAIHKFSENTVDKENRNSLLQSALTLTETMKNNATKLYEQYDNINKNIESSVININRISESIADLNNAIFSYELSGAKANDLRDKRNMLLDELSGIIPISYDTSSEGYFSVKFNGRDLVNHADFNTLSTVSNKDHAFNDTAQVHQVYWSDQLTGGVPDTDPATGDPYPPMNITEGSLGGYFQMRDGDTESKVGIPYVMNMLDKLCQKVVKDFNAVQVKGYGIPNASVIQPAPPAPQIPTGSVNGIKFFDDNIVPLTFDANGDIATYRRADDATNTPITGNPYADDDEFNGVNGAKITALNFNVSDAIEKNVYLIAGSDTQVGANADNEQKGNNKNALAMVGLLTQKDASNNPDNFDSMYKNILVNVGLKMSQISRTADNQATVQASINGQRASIMNVSLDEEITNVVKFGHSYNAASRVISAIDEQLDVIINRMGMVGR